MALLPAKWFRSPSPVVTPSAPKNVPISFAERRPRPPLAAVGVAGVSQFGGVLYHDDYDLAWQTGNRDTTIEHMLNDPVIGAALFGAEMIIRRVQWRLEPADDSAEARKWADFTQTCLEDMRGYWPGETMARVLTYLGWGWCVLSVGYKQRVGQPVSKYDDGLIGWDQWLLIPQKTRMEWRFDDYGFATSLIQQDPTNNKTYEIDLDRALHFRFANRDNSPEGTTPLRVAYDSWYRGSRVKVIEGIGIERDLAGLPVMRIPGNHIEESDQVYTESTKIVTTVRNDAQAGLVLSSDRDETGNYEQDFALVSTGGGRAIDTDSVVRRYANETLMALLANVMRTGQDTVGSYSLAESMGDLFQQGLGAQLDVIGDVINSQAIPQLLRVNGVSADLWPRIAHDDIENINLQRLGTYLTDLAQAGVLGDTPELREFVHNVAGLPTPSAEEIRLQMEKEAAAAEAAAQAQAKTQPSPTQEPVDQPI